jgi:hypothetical protein
MRLIGVFFIFAALVAAGMAAETHEWQGWAFSFAFGCAAAYLVLNPRKNN